MVVIVLAAYNGEEFIAEQLESICNQSWADWTLLVRDDGSTDRTVSIVEDFCRKDRRIQLMGSGRRRSGPASNFCRLLMHAERIGGEYVCFSDQDDVWLPGKLQHQLDMMWSLEQQHGPGAPILVHTDMIEADARLDVIRPSYAKHKRHLLATPDPFATLLTANFVTGCTMLINRSLLNIGLPIPSIAIMHDHWFALCAAAAGMIGYLEQSTLLYRRHGRNYSRAATPWPSLGRFVRGGYWSAYRVAQFARRIEQLRVLHAHLKVQNIPAADGPLERLDRYCQVFEIPAHWVHRLRDIARLSIPRMGLLRNIQFLVLVQMLDNGLAIDPQFRSLEQPESSAAARAVHRWADSRVPSELLR